MSEPKDFHTKLKEECKKKNITQEYLAERVGITTRTLQNYKNENRLPNLFTAIKICNELNVTLDYMFLDLDDTITDSDIYNKLITLFVRQDDRKLSYAYLFMDFLEKYYSKD